MQDYIDPILKKYADLIKANTGAFKEFYYGDPIRIPASSLPVLILAKIDTRVANLTNAEDKHDIRISLTAVTDIRTSIQEDKTMVAGVNMLYNLMEGRNADYTLKQDSLLNILRHSVELDIANNLRTDISTMTRVDYGITMGKRAPDAWSTEGTLELTASFTQIR